MEFAFQFIVWLVLTVITLVAAAGLDWFAVTVLSSLVVAAIWAVIVWGGILILDDIDSIF